MASKKSARTPYRWANGTWHTRPEGEQNRSNYQAPPTPQAPATPPVQPMDPSVVNAQVTAQRNVGVADLYSTWNQGNLDQDYGFGAGGAANPYSQAALLQENYRRAKTGTVTSYTNEQQQFSGAYGRMQTENTRNYDIGYDQLRRGYDQATGENQFGRLREYANAGTGVDDATYEALRRQLGGL